jgi:hypothetical protein
VITLRKELIADGTLVQKDGFYRFAKDVEFSSPSAAAAVIEGGSANGLIEWRTKDGRVLKELDEQASRNVAAAGAAGENSLATSCSRGLAAATLPVRRHNQCNEA